MKKIIVIALPIAFLICGCLQDNIDTYQVVPRTIYQPNAVYFKCITGTTDLQILWNPPLSDTQQNYKGYFIELFNSTPFVPVASDGIDSLLGTQIDSGQVLKIDTSYIFKGHGQIVQGGRYTVRIWGLRFPDPKKPDSLVTSQYPAALSFNYDSRADSVPTQILASSAGPNSINLFWSPSVSEGNIGMAGYIIRYLDPTDKSSRVAYYTRISKDTAYSQLLNGKYYYTTIALQGLPSPPIERPYMLWLKTVRQDSVESADSIGIEWSGAERIPLTNLAVKLDTGIFMGAVSFQYNLVQADPVTDSTQFQILQSQNSVIVNALHGTLFSTKIAQDTSTLFSLDKNYFSAPFSDADFTATQVSFPKTGADFGTIVYARLSSGNRARIFFSKDSAGVSSSYIRPDSTLTIQASFQPLEPVQLPYW